ncbi:amidase [Acetobacter nitrogenifigens DSM 23921 = NBRC 105050]|uniref:Amidase n=1 Tax=Acetobacter nitrogenifigens DSM 23921 = NBRC 105050 TaxID=1120919 RepID=A0A511XFB2_9PROT|nr:amidase [Acetobacter nitrogenifigens]GBQ94899.1 amidase [Acetobacter nitrogenifigens DSM 23921 = NBRC 105050]GEN61643.1 amidase [Acetobacter nitrogenifigens DSM 23921 = NBRC 105050]
MKDVSQHVAEKLSRIDHFDSSVRAFSAYDPGRAGVAAQRPGDGVLSGLVVGVKDIIDTEDYPTTYGSGIYENHRSRGDAACVTLLRSAGAVVAGKTVTTEFAFFRPGPTVNPFDGARTPGGSSSGSAAAVAAGMIDIGLASQTAASLTRPASYCGVVGFKPSYGRYALSGVKALGPSFDALGVITPDVKIAALADSVLQGPVPTPVALTPSRPSRIGVCRTPWWREAEEGTRMAMASASDLLRDETSMEEVDLSDFVEANDLHVTIMSYEAAQALAWEYQERRNLLSPQIIGLIEAGRKISRSTYVAATEKASALRRRMDAVLDRYDVLLAPAAPGEAPLRENGTGAPTFSRMWTLLHLPSLTLPGLTGPAGLPVGVQLVGRMGDDAGLLEYGAWAEAIFPPRPLPRLADGASV